jgi:triphosphoribosyl-dephospho-CoA synthase
MKTARALFIAACRLDVLVRKPGNVSRHSPGHGMTAAQFVASADAAAEPLFAPGTRVGERIENAQAASWAAAGCNTNLGILLLCAPIAAAVEIEGATHGAASLQAAIETVLAGLDIADARAAYRAIAAANPGGLGHAPAQDVRDAPSIGLREAMRLAAPRDSIARQYANGFADLFELAAPLCESGFSLMADSATDAVDAATASQVRRVFLNALVRWPDSHIVRKHGEAVAQTVMAAAQTWPAHGAPGTDPRFAAWDESLKAAHINPGTSADLTVAALFLAGLRATAWHGS